MQIRGDFLIFGDFLRTVELLEEFQGNTPLELDDQCKFLFKAGQGAVLSNFWHERCYFLSSVRVPVA
jgi:hypothetical protein